jgi:hypothetical protein
MIRHFGKAKERKRKEKTFYSLWAVGEKYVPRHMGEPFLLL